MYAANRRQKHDRAGALVEHHSTGRLSAQKIALEADIDHHIPGFLGQFFEFGRLQFDGAADDAVDGTKRGDRFVGHALRVGGTRRIHLDDGGLAALACTRAAVCSASARSISATATSAPSRAARTAVARPMPLAAPVTMIFLPFNIMIILPVAAIDPPVNYSLAG